MKNNGNLKRADARRWAMKLIFQYSFTGESFDELIEAARSFEEFEPYADDEYLRDIVKKTIDNVQSIDDAIAACSKKWAKNRISKTSLAIMRLSIAEMRYRKDTPMAISINEAVETAKEYDTENSTSFINGVLNAVAEKEGLK